MKRTSRPFVNTTISGVDGRPLTVLNSERTFEANFRWYDRWQDDRYGAMLFLWWEMKAKIRHRFGKHTWVHVESYDWTEDEEHQEFSAEVCWGCSINPRFRR
jgi:hypothetical protein